MNIKEVVIKKFLNSKFENTDSIPIDEEIAEFIYELNKSKNIITTNSCAGHDTLESANKYDFISHPYLAFVVNERGWEMFWSTVLPIVASTVLIHVQICNDGEKVAIVIRSHYEDKRDFWNAMQKYLVII